MLWYHLKLSILRLIKNRAFSGTIIIGLSIGIASFFLLFLHVQNERSYDKYIPDYENIYRVVSTPIHVDSPWARSLGFIKDAAINLPEVEDACQFSHCKIGTIKINDQSVSQADILSVDTNFMNLFGIKSLIGNLSDIAKPNVAFVSEKFAQKYFKNTNPIGQTIEVEELQYLRDLGKYEIIGIIKNIPFKTHFNCEILLSQNGSLTNRYAGLASSKMQWVYNYLKLKKKVSPSTVEEKLLNVFNNSEFKQTRGPKDYKFSLFRLTDIHLKSDFKFELKESSTKVNINLFTLIAFVILLVSLINFVSLLTVTLFKRSKEFGLKTSIGAHRKHLLVQLVIEVLLLCSLSTFFSLFLIELVKPFINSYFEIQFDIFYSEQSIYFAILAVLLFSSCICLMFVRFFILKNNSAGELLKGLNSLAGKRLLQPLMIFQILIVIVLLSSTFSINKQIDYLLNKDLGFSKNNVVVLNLKDFSKDPYVFANELRKNPLIENVGFTMQYFGYPTQTFSLEEFNIEGTTEMSIVNYEFLKTMNIQFIHNFINPLKDTIEGMVINRHLYNKLMVEHKSLENLEVHLASRPLQEDQRRFSIVGVVEDFNYSSAHDQIGNYIFWLGESRNRARFIHVRLSPENTKKALNVILEEWKKYYSNQKMDYFFMDDKIAQQYKSEDILKRILMSFSILGIIIGILGVSALSFFISEQRTKEIGIRKVNGAKTHEIITMLNKNFLKWVAMAFVLACPIAWYAMHKWLENFAYKTELSWWIFALAGLIAMGITLLTVSFQSWKAASRNPVESLRYE